MFNARKHVRNIVEKIKKIKIISSNLPTDRYNYSEKINIGTTNTILK